MPAPLCRVAGGVNVPGSALGDVGYDDLGDPAVRAAHRGTRPVIKMLGKDIGH